MKYEKAKAEVVLFDLDNVLCRSKLCENLANHVDDCDQTSVREDYCGWPWWGYAGVCVNIVVKV